MYNLRYHVASLVAVFLALAVGLVLGTVVVERGALDSQKSSLVTGLQDEFKSMRTENDDLRTQLQHEQSFASAAVAPLVADRLKGRTVLLVCNAGRTDGLSDAADAIKAAGGRSAVIVFTSEGLDLKDATLAQQVERTIGDATDYDDLVSKTASALAGEWRKPGRRPLTQLLVSAGKITIDGFDSSVSADGCGVLASWDGKPDDVALSVASAMRTSGAATVAIQSAKRDTGVAEAGSDRGLSAIDHVGTAEGNVSLVWLLTGTVQGRYGTGDGAQALFPKLQ